MSMNSSPQNPYHSQFDTSAPPPPKKSKLGLILAIIAGVVFLGFLACCGGGYFFMNLGFDVIGAQATNSIRAHPQAAAKLGEVKSCKVDFVASAAHPENQKPGNTRQIMVFNVEGANGSGVLTAEVVNQPGQQEMRLIELRMSSGEVVRFGP
jgi:hypothetical protein